MGCLTYFQRRMHGAIHEKIIIICRGSQVVLGLNCIYSSDFMSVFLLERLGVAAACMYCLFQRGMETLETQLFSPFLYWRSVHMEPNEP